MAPSYRYTLISKTLCWTVISSYLMVTPHVASKTIIQQQQQHPRGLEPKHQQRFPIRSTVISIGSTYCFLGLGRVAGQISHRSILIPTLTQPKTAAFCLTASPSATPLGKCGSLPTALLRISGYPGFRPHLYISENAMFCCRGKELLLLVSTYVALLHYMLPSVCTYMRVHRPE
ncbi:hypothetical protein F4815DRAFT_453167 [Daldinia loculata]|nr:hypothetical protein F4815DRAFT_453167 [Daldinia loculata]